MTTAIDVKGLRKSYGSLEAVRSVDLEIAAGEVFALLGPNGAGKTTIVEILEGYRRRDAGEVAVLGLDPGRQRAKLKPRIGIVLQSTGVDRYLTVAETIAMYSSYYPHPRPVDEVIEVVGLTGKRNSRVVRLSGGQQRRLDVEIAPVNLTAALHRLTGWAIEHGFDLDDLQVLRPSLEDVYLQLTGGQVEAAVPMEGGR